MKSIDRPNAARTADRPRRNRPSLPGEHGAYIVLLCSWLLGMLRAPGIDPIPTALSLVTPLALFLGLGPSRALLRNKRLGRRVSSDSIDLRWTIVLAGTGLLAGLALLASRPDVLMLAIPAVLLGAIYLVAEYRRRSMTTLSMIGFVALALTGPLARIAAAPNATTTELLLLWLLPAAFYSASAYTVHIRLVGAPGIRRAVGFHLTVTAALVALASAGLVPLVAVVAMLVAVGKLVWIVLDLGRYRAMTLKRIGLLESAGSTIFLLLMAAW